MTGRPADGRPGTIEADASYAAFVAHLADRWTLGPVGLASAGPGARLADDLGVDSLALLELVLVLDDLGVALDEADLARCATLGDVHRHARATTGGVRRW